MKVAEVGSITGAANALNVAQPALGLQVKMLEQELGVSLLQRHSRGVKLTDAGRKLAERASTILESIAETRDEIIALGMGATETIRLGLTPNVIGLINQDLVQKARKELPQVNLVIAEGISIALVEMLRRSEIDIALAYSVGESPGLSRRALYEEELFLITARKGAPSQSALTLDQVLQHELAIMTERSTVYRQLVETAKQAALQIRVSYTAKSNEALLQLAAHGLASAILPFNTAIREINGGSVVATRIEKPGITRILYLVQPSGNHRFRYQDKLESFLRRSLRESQKFVSKLNATPERGGRNKGASRTARNTR